MGLVKDLGLKRWKTIKSSVRSGTYDSPGFPKYKSRWMSSSKLRGFFGAPGQSKDIVTIEAPFPYFSTAFNLPKKYGVLSKKASEIKFYQLGKYPYDYGQQNYTSKLRFNKRVVDDAIKLFDAWKRYGLHNKILHQAGSYNVRKMRTSGNYSWHSWGIAFDVSTTPNQLGWEPARKNMFGCLYEHAKIALELGWYWGGFFGDGMHFEYNKEPTLVIPVKNDFVVDDDTGKSSSETSDSTIFASDDTSGSVTDDQVAYSDTEIVSGGEFDKGLTAGSVFGELNDFLLTGTDIASSVPDKKEIEKTKTEDEEKPIITIVNAEHITDDIIINTDETT